MHRRFIAICLIVLLQSTAIADSRPLGGREVTVPPVNWIVLGLGGWYKLGDDGLATVIEELEDDWRPVYKIRRRVRSKYEVILG